MMKLPCQTTKAPGIEIEVPRDNIKVSHQLVNFYLRQLWRSIIIRSKLFLTNNKDTLLFLQNR